MTRSAGGRRPAHRKRAKKSSFAMLLIRLALAALVVLALVWGANQVMFFLFRHGLY